MSGIAHVLHLIMTIIFWPWLIIWVGCAVSAGNQRKRKEDRRKDEELELLRKIANK